MYSVAAFINVPRIFEGKSYSLETCRKIRDREKKELSRRGEDFWSPRRSSPRFSKSTLPPRASRRPCGVSNSLDAIKLSLPLSLNKRACCEVRPESCLDRSESVRVTKIVEFNIYDPRLPPGSFPSGECEARRRKIRERFLDGGEISGARGRGVARGRSISRLQDGIKTRVRLLVARKKGKRREKERGEKKENPGGNHWKPRKVIKLSARGCEGVRGDSKGGEETRNEWTKRRCHQIFKLPVSKTLLVQWILDPVSQLTALFIIRNFDSSI